MNRLRESVFFSVLDISAQFLDGIRVKWLGESVVLKEQPEDTQLVSTPVDTSDVLATDGGIDKFVQ